MSSSSGCFANRAPSTVFVWHFSRYPSITNRVSVPGRNISSSQCGMGLNMEKPRIRYRPSSDLVWMSLITSGVKIRLCPSTCLPLLSAMSEHQPPPAGFDVVVVPQLAAADELAEPVRLRQPVDAELSVDQLLVGVGELRLHTVHPERGHLAADVDRAVVHRVA